MRVQNGLKDSLKLALAKGMSIPDMPTVRKANYSGITFCLMFALALALGCLLASCVHAEDVDMDKIAMIESSGCKNLVGDLGEALGCHQLHKGVVKEYNQFKHTSWAHGAVMDEDISYRIASWYMNKRIPVMLKHYKIKDTLENRLSCYNMGIGNVIKGKLATAYINKYNKLKEVN